MRNICTKLFQNPPIKWWIYSMDKLYLWTYLNLWPLGVTFGVRDMGLVHDHPLHMVNICAKLFQNPPMNDEFTVQTSCIMPILNIWPWSVTLTYELGIWVLHVTCHLHMVNICAKLVKNPSINNNLQSGQDRMDRRMDGRKNIHWTAIVTTKSSYRKWARQKIKFSFGAGFPFCFWIFLEYFSTVKTVSYLWYIWELSLAIN